MPKHHEYSINAIEPPLARAWKRLAPRPIKENGAACIGSCGPTELSDGSRSRGGGTIAMRPMDGAPCARSVRSSISRT